MKPAFTLVSNSTELAEPVTEVRESYVRELAPRPAPEEETQAARHVIAALVEAGVDTFFGIPGGPVCAVFDAILQTPGARLVESRHETAAAFEAVGFYRAPGRAAEGSYSRTAVPRDSTSSICSRASRVLQSAWLTRVQPPHRRSLLWMLRPTPSGPALRC